MTATATTSNELDAVTDPVCLMSGDDDKKQESLPHTQDPFWDDYNDIAAVVEFDFDTLSAYLFRGSLLWGCWFLLVQPALFWMPTDSGWVFFVLLSAWNVAFSIGFGGWWLCRLIRSNVRGMHAAVTHQGILYHHVGPSALLQRNVQLSWDQIDDCRVGPVWCSWLAPHPLYQVRIVPTACTTQKAVTLWGMVNHKEIYQLISSARKRTSSSHYRDEDEDATLSTMTSMLEITSGRSELQLAQMPDEQKDSRV